MGTASCWGADPEGVLGLSSHTALEMENRVCSVLGGLQ